MNVGADVGKPPFLRVQRIKLKVAGAPRAACALVAALRFDPRLRAGVVGHVASRLVELPTAPF